MAKTKIDPIQTTRTAPKVRSWANYVHGEQPTDLEKPKGVSETIPDMALSLNELLTRHTRGLNIPSKTPVYNEDLPDFNKMDLTEINDFKEQNAERIRDIQAKLAQDEATRLARKKALAQNAGIPSEPEEPTSPTT